MLDKIKALMDMQKKMQDVKRQLDSLEFQVASPDGAVTVIMNGSQQVQKVVLKAGYQANEALEHSLKDVFNRAIKRSHEVAADKMKTVTGMNLPGL